MNFILTESWPSDRRIILALWCFQITIVLSLTIFVREIGIFTLKPLNDLFNNLKDIAEQNFIDNLKNVYSILPTNIITAFFFFSISHIFIMLKNKKVYFNRYIPMIIILFGYFTVSIKIGLAIGRFDRLSILGSLELWLRICGAHGFFELWAFCMIIFYSIKATLDESSIGFYQYVGWKLIGKIIVLLIICAFIECFVTSRIIAGIFC